MKHQHHEWFTDHRRFKYILHNSNRWFIIHSENWIESNPIAILLAMHTAHTAFVHKLNTTKWIRRSADQCVLESEWDKGETSQVKRYNLFLCIHVCTIFRSTMMIELISFWIVRFSMPSHTQIILPQYLWLHSSNHFICFVCSKIWGRRFKYAENDEREKKIK